jgi:hypothetical protein
MGSVRPKRPQVVVGQGSSYSHAGLVLEGRCATQRRQILRSFGLGGTSHSRFGSVL